MFTEIVALLFTFKYWYNSITQVIHLSHKLRQYGNAFSEEEDIENN